MMRKTFLTSALDMPEIMSYIYNKSWKLQFSASSSIIIIEDFYLQTFLHSLRKQNLLKTIYTYIANEKTDKNDVSYSSIEIIYVFLTIFLYLLKCPQSLILSALRAFCFCGKAHIPRSIFLYFRYQSWLKSW